MSSESFTVLMAEDNEDDVLVTQRAWKKSNILNSLQIVKNGEECLDYLRRRGKYSDPLSSPRPSLLLLDIKMPKLDGISVLKRVREDPQFSRMPVVMLTTSKMESDRIKCYDLGANAYITKPIGFLNLAEAMRILNLFWGLVDFPDQDN